MTDGSAKLLTSGRSGYIVKPDGELSFVSVSNPDDFELNVPPGAEVIESDVPPAVARVRRNQKGALEVYDATSEIESEQQNRVLARKADLSSKIEEASRDPDKLAALLKGLFGVK